MDVRGKLSSEKRLIDANKLIDFIDVGHLRHPGELCYSEVDVANILLHASNKIASFSAFHHISSSRLKSLFRKSQIPIQVLAYH